MVSLGQVWHLIVSIPDLCRLSYYDMNANHIVFFNFNRISFAKTVFSQMFRHLRSNSSLLVTMATRNKLRELNID